MAQHLFLCHWIGLAKSFRNLILTSHVGHGHLPVKKTVTGNFWSCLPVAQWDGVFARTSKRWRERQIRDAVQNESQSDWRWHNAVVAVNHVIYYFFQGIADSKPKSQKSKKQNKDLVQGWNLPQSISPLIWLESLVHLTFVKVGCFEEKQKNPGWINIDGFERNKQWCVPKISAADPLWASVFFKFIIWKLAFRCKSMESRLWEKSISSNRLSCFLAISYSQASALNKSL